MRQMIWTVLLLLLTTGCARPESQPQLQRQALPLSGSSQEARPVTIQTEPLPIAKQMEGVTGIVQVRVSEQGFEPAVLLTHLGERVKIHLVNQGEKEHNLTLPRWGVFIQNLQPAGETYIEFTASERGAWPFFSSALGEPEPGLTGQLVVE